MSKLLATVGRKNSVLIERNLHQNQAQGGASAVTAWGERRDRGPKTHCGGEPEMNNLN